MNFRFSRYENVNGNGKMIAKKFFFRQTALCLFFISAERMSGLYITRYLSTVWLFMVDWANQNYLPCAIVTLKRLYFFLTHKVIDRPKITLNLVSFFFISSKKKWIGFRSLKCFSKRVLVSSFNFAKQILWCRNNELNSLTA